MKFNFLFRTKKTEDTEVQEQVGISGEETESKEEEQPLCDRCGNDLLKGDFLFHLPFRGGYISFCHVCIKGLMYGFYQDVMRDIKNSN